MFAFNALFTPNSNRMASNQRPVRTLPLPAEHPGDSENMMMDVSLSTTLPRPDTPSGQVRRSSRIQNSPKPDYKGTAGRLNTRYDAKILGHWI